MLENIKYMFKSKEEKERETKRAVKSSIRELNRLDQTIETKMNDMAKMAKKARVQGLDSQYKLAFNALKMMMEQQRRVKSMALQIDIIDIIRTLHIASNRFIVMCGRVGKEATDLVKRINAGEKIADFEKGFDLINGSMDDLNDFMADNANVFGEMSKESGDSTAITDAEIEALISALPVTERVAAPAQPQREGEAPASMDDEIARRMKELNNKV